MPEVSERNLFDKIFVSFFSAILVVNSLLMTLIITGAATTRYILKINFYGYDEIAVLVAFWMYFMGAAYGAYNNSHVTADIVDAYCPQGFVKRILTLTRWIATCVACGLFVYYGFEYLKFSVVGPIGNFQFQPKSMVWRIPLWITYASVFMGLVFMEVYFLRNFVLSARALLKEKGGAAGVALLVLIAIFLAWMIPSLKAEPIAGASTPMLAFLGTGAMVYVALGILISALLLGVPVPVSFMASAAWLIYFGGPDGRGYDPAQLLPHGYLQMSSVSLMAIALFIIAGGLMEKGKIGEKLIDFVDVFCGSVKGGLGVVGTVSCAVFGSITGAACATLSCIGAIMFPRLEQAGYPKGHTAALMANASLLGLLIPPNGTLIIFAWISGQSVLACFLSTVSAGVVVTLLISLANIWLLKDTPSVLVAHKRTEAEKFALFKKRGVLAIPALFLPVLVLGTIYGGIMTPTEASATAVLYAIPVGMFVYKGLTLRGLADCLVESGVTTGVIMVMLYSVSMLSRLYILEDLPGKVLNLFYSVSSNKWVIMGMINIFLVIMGMLMDDISVVTLTTPILMPIILHLGFSPIHYAAVVGVNTALGCITPPAAPVLYLAGRLSNTPINEMMRPALWLMFLCWIPALIFVAYFPKLVLFFPHIVLGTPW